MGTVKCAKIPTGLYSAKRDNFSIRQYDTVNMTVLAPSGSTNDLGLHRQSPVASDRNWRYERLP